MQCSFIMLEILSDTLAIIHLKGWKIYGSVGKLLKWEKNLFYFLATQLFNHSWH